MQRRVVVVTGFAVALVGGALAFLTWDQANKVAGVLSALVGIAALGAAVAGLVAPARPQPGGVEVSDTGTATATGAGSTANTGVSYGDGASQPVTGQIKVTRTGGAEAERGGRANSGHQQD